MHKVHQQCNLCYLCLIKVKKLVKITKLYNLGVEPWLMARWKARVEFLLSVIELHLLMII